MFICKICGLVYPSEPSKCLNDGYKDFAEIREHIAMPSLTIRFSEIQENIFSIYSFPTDILTLDTKNSFYYGFRPEIREFPVKLKLNDIFKPEEVVFESFDEGNNKLNMTINSDNSDYKVLLKEKTNREYKVVDIKENIILTGRPTEHNIYDELLIKNIIVKFIGIK